jgi:hypothetical protein
MRAAALAIVGVGSLAFAFAPSASAGIILPSSTVVTAAPSTTDLGSPVTLTAKVRAAIVGGVIITPTGKVTFTYTNGSSSGTLGRASIGTCLLSACTARITTSALPAGTNTVRGTYGGDLVVTASSGTTTVTVIAPPPPPPDSSTVTCDAGQPCQTDTVSAGDTSMDVASSSSGSQQTVSAMLELGKTLQCPEDSDTMLGALGTFEVSATDTTITVRYNGKGSVGQTMLNNYAAHTLYAGCFGSPTPFNGYVGGVFGPAALVHEPDGDLYEAQLSNCANNDGATPCFTNIQETDGSDTYQVTTQLSDPPRIIG